MIWPQLRYHEKQSELWRTSARFVAVAAGRGSGKTELARRRVVRYLPVKKEWSNPLYFYALPTTPQAKRVAWNQIIDLIPKHWISDINKTDLFIDTIFGSRLYVFGLDRPHRAEGVQWDGGVIDESCDQKPGLFERTFMPAFSHRNAWCWRIGVPKRHGIGAADFHNFFDNVADESYSWPSADILPESELNVARQTLDAVDFAEQYGANWQTISGGIFHAFTDTNIRPCEYISNKAICVGSDFNVSPMSWCLGHVINDTLYIFDEIKRNNANTRGTLDNLFARYGSHAGGWAFFGDATGRARKTSASESDYIQIKNDKRFKNSKVYYLKSNPSRVDRFASTNMKLCNAAGMQTLFVDPKCKSLIHDLKNRNYKEGTSEPEDGPDMGHMSDALGYVIHYLWPLRVKNSEVAARIHALGI